MKLKKKLFAVVLVVAMACLQIPALTAFAADKDVWIDNTVDASTSQIQGVLKLTDGKGDVIETTTVFDSTVEVTFSEPRSTEVVNAINEAKLALQQSAAEKGYTITGEAEETSSTLRVFDNRKYETLEDTEPVPQGEQGGDGTGSEGAGKTHIASGDYGKETLFTISMTAIKENAPEDTYVGVAFGTTEGGKYSINGGELQDYAMNMTANANDTIQLHAEPDDGWVFKGWFEGIIGASYFVESPGETLISESADFSFTASAGYKLCAVFEEKAEEPSEPGETPAEGGNEGKPSNPDDLGKWGKDWGESGTGSSKPLSIASPRVSLPKIASANNANWNFSIGKGSSIPKTGDTTNISWYVWAAIGGGIILIVAIILLIVGKNRREQDGEMNESDRFDE